MDDNTNNSNSGMVLLAGIKEIREVFESDHADAEIKLNSLIRLRKFLDDPTTKTMFINEFYYEIMTCLLNRINIGNANDSEGVLKIQFLLWDLLKNGPPDQSFSILFQFIRNSNPNTLQFEKAIMWMIELIKNGTVKKVLIAKAWQNVNNVEQPIILDDHFNEFIQLVVSFPTILANKLLGLNFYEELQPTNYVETLSKDILESLFFIHDRMKENQNSSIQPIAKFIGKICLSGYGQPLWKNLTKELNKNLKAFTWRRIIQKIIISIEDWCFETSIEPLLPLLQNFDDYDYYFGDIFLKKTKLDHLLSYKLILIKFSSDVKTLKNILVFLGYRSGLEKTFTKCLKNILETWKKEIFVKHRSAEQILYLSKAIMISLNIINKNRDFLDDVKEVANKTLLEGLPVYLNSSIPNVRFIGMVVCQTMASIIHPGDNKLELPYEKNEITASLIALLDENLLPKSKLQIDDNEEKTQSEDDSANDKQKMTSTDLDSDDDDDLQPLNANVTVKMSKKEPQYLGQCIEGLLSQDDPELFEEYLKKSELLVENHLEQKELHLELCKILLNLENRFTIKDFELTRHKALLSLITNSPELIAEFLGNEFYEKNYNLKQRMDILNVLVDGAKCLTFSEFKDLESKASNNTTTNSQDNNKSHQLYTKFLKSQTPPPENRTDWRLVVQERIDKKTRRFAKDRTSIKIPEVKNKFATCSAWFFYPLMKNYDKKGICMDITGEDHIVLEKLLVSLGTIMYCSLNIPTACHMAKYLLQFVSCFRKHAEIGVRRAVMFCTCMCLIVLDSNCSLSNLMYELDDVGQWLNNVSSQEWDEQSIDLANQTIVLLNKLKLKF